MKSTCLLLATLLFAGCSAPKTEQKEDTPKKASTDDGRKAEPKVEKKVEPKPEPKPKTDAKPELEPETEEPEVPNPETEDPGTTEDEPAIDCDTTVDLDDAFVCLTGGIQDVTAHASTDSTEKTALEDGLAKIEAALPQYADQTGQAILCARTATLNLRLSTMAFQAQEVQVFTLARLGIARIQAIASCL